MKKLIATAGVALGLSLAATSPSHAHMNADPSQPAMGMMGGGCPTMTMMGSGMMSQGMAGDGNQGMMGDQVRMDAMADGRLAYLKTELDLTEAQMPAWNGYADAVKANMANMQDMRSDMMMAMQGSEGGNSASMSQMMDARITGMEAMLNAMKTVRPASEALYEVLNDGQKQKADHLIGFDCGAM